MIIQLQRYLNIVYHLMCSMFWLWLYHTIRQILPHIFVCVRWPVIKTETCRTLDNKHCPICVPLTFIFIYLQFHSLHLDFPFGKLCPWEQSPPKQHPVTGIRVRHDIPLYHIPLKHRDAYVSDTPLLPTIQSDLHLASSATRGCRDVCMRLTTDNT